MTDVFGAEGPPERFSSLLIRAAWAAAAADGSGLEDSCGMAQAFKFPTEAYDGSPRSPGLRSFAQAHRLLDRRFQPVRSKPDRPHRIWACPRLAASVRQLGRCGHGGPDSRSGRSSPRLINPD